MTEELTGPDRRAPGASSEPATAISGRRRRAAAGPAPWPRWHLGAAADRRHGVALVWGGVFVADPADGFPPGTPPGHPDQLSWHSILHTPGPVVALLSLIVACFVFARRFRRIGRRGWAAYCTATGVAGPIIAVTAFSTGDFRWLFAGGVLLWGWASVMAAQLLIGRPDATGELR